jgi:N4-gp56 family major capsid protein
MAIGKAVAFLQWLGHDQVTTVAPTTAGAAVTNAAGWTATEILADDGSKFSTSGNLYGSSKDVGTIMGKMPVLSETGGRVNRVGMKRLTLEGHLEKFGFFEEYTQESLDFDTDSELMMHITQEAVKAANEITEDQLQIDLLHSAGVIRYTGSASSAIELNGDKKTGGAAGAPDEATDVVTYDDLVKLGIELDNNRTPKNTKVITGSRMIDTRVVNSARYMYIGSELLTSLMRMTDYHGNPAWIPVAQYGAATTIARGEVGSVADFRIIVVPEMMHWEGAGKAVTSGSEFAMNNGHNYNVYPMLVVGDGSFTTVGFQTDGKSVKFRITHKQPGREIADRMDPYGEVGFYSIKWYYGFMVMRPERIALVKTVAAY